MASVIAQGPISGSALCVSPPVHRVRPTAAAARIGPRRPIGTGPRPIIVTDPARIASRRIARPTPRRRAMKRPGLYVTSFFAVVLSLAALGISASMDMPSTLMSPANYEQLRRAIEADTRSALAHCRDASGIERQICRAEVRAVDRVKKADLQATYLGTVNAQQDARLARARAAYEVAKARCGAQPGEARIGCLRNARANRESAAS
jgi:hypothetical protein